MKTREEMAKENAAPAFAKLHGNFLGVDQDFVETTFKEGFDAGFARACELLKSDAAIEEGLNPAEGPLWADWLEKQCP